MSMSTDEETLILTLPKYDAHDPKKRTPLFRSSFLASSCVTDRIQVFEFASAIPTPSLFFCFFQFSKCPDS